MKKETPCGDGLRTRTVELAHGGGGMDYIGIYWTRAVPWRGFTTLSANVDEACAQSRTIRYQRALVRSHVGSSLRGELVFFEQTTDRADPMTFADLPQRLARLRREVGKALEKPHFLWVDFSEVNNWRRNRPMIVAMEAIPEATHESVAMREIEMMGAITRTQLGSFDPIRHFNAWEEDTQAHIRNAPAHAVEIFEHLRHSPARSWPDKAKALNELGARTHSGLPWTPDNLRAFHKRWKAEIWTSDVRPVDNE